MPFRRSAVTWFRVAMLALAIEGCTVETRTYLEPSADRGDVGRLARGGKCGGAVPSFFFFHPPNLPYVNVALGATLTDQLVLLIAKSGPGGFVESTERARVEAWRRQAMSVSATICPPDAHSTVFWATGDSPWSANQCARAAMIMALASALPRLVPRRMPS